MDAPLAFNTAELPTQTLALVATTVGNAFTVTEPIAVFLQPELAIPVTV